MSTSSQLIPSTRNVRNDDWAMQRILMHVIKLCCEGVRAKFMPDKNEFKQFQMTINYFPSRKQFLNTIHTSFLSIKH